MKTLVLISCLSFAAGSFQIDCEFGKPCQDICPSGQVVSDFTVGAKPWAASSAPQGFRFRITCKTPNRELVSETPFISSLDSTSHLLYRDISFADARHLAKSYPSPKTELSRDLSCPETAQMDLIFLIDASVSISRKNFEEQKQFVKNFISSYRIEPDWTRVALITFAGEARTEFTMTNVTQNLQAVLKAVSLARFVGGGTDLSKALEAAQEIISADPMPRFRASKAVILVTDGGHTSRGMPPYIPARRLRQNGVDIFAVSPTRPASLSQLRSIVQHKRRLYPLQAFDNLPAAASRLSIDICQSVLSLE